MKKASRVFYIFSGLLSLFASFLLLVTALAFIFDIPWIALFAFCDFSNMTFSFEHVTAASIFSILFEGSIALFCLSLSILAFVCGVLSFVGLVNKKAINIINIVFGVFGLINACLVFPLALLSTYSLIGWIRTIIELSEIVGGFMNLVNINGGWMFVAREIALCITDVTLFVCYHLATPILLFAGLFEVLAGIFGLINNHKEKKQKLLEEATIEEIGGENL